MEFPPGVELTVKGWRLGAKANTFPSRLIFPLLPTPPSWWGECNAQRAGVLILNVCSFTRIKGLVPLLPQQRMSILRVPVLSLERGRSFFPLPGSFVSLYICINVDQKGEKSRPGCYDHLLVHCASRPPQTTCSISDKIAQWFRAGTLETACLGLNPSPATY